LASDQRPRWHGKLHPGDWLRSLESKWSARETHMVLLQVLWIEIRRLNCHGAIPLIKYATHTHVIIPRASNHSQCATRSVLRISQRILALCLPAEDAASRKHRLSRMSYARLDLL
jgi:hypothetical protein